MSFPPPAIDVAPVRTTVGAGSPIVAIGALGIVISIFTEWGTAELFGDSLAGKDIPIEFLNDTTPSSLDSSSIVFFLVPAVIAIVIGLAVAKARWLSIAGGVGALVVALLYVRAVNAAADYYDFDAGLSDLIGIGTWICAIGGVLAVVGGVMALRRRP